jgi:hypothetical protein
MRLHELRDKVGAQGRPTTGSETPERLPATDFASQNAKKKKLLACKY